MCQITYVAWRIYYDFGCCSKEVVMTEKLNRIKSDLVRGLVEKGLSRSNGEIRLGTHNGEFHADDLLATAVLRTAIRRTGIPVHTRVIRTRDFDTLENYCDIAYDVGNGKYDHHSADRVLYPNGVPMAACGKVLNDVIVDEDIKDALRYKLFYAVEALDNGVQPPCSFEGSKLQFVPLFNPTWEEMDDERTLYKRFMSTLDIVGAIYTRTLEYAASEARGEQYINDYGHIIRDGAFLLLDRHCPTREFARKHPDLRAVVYPKRNLWVVRCIQQFGLQPRARTLFPKIWRGEHGAVLKSVSGFDDIRFCHRAGFIAGFDSRHSALAALEFLTNPSEEEATCQQFDEIELGTWSPE